MIDARGHRSAPARPGAPKIVALGGSTLFGFGLPSDDTTFAWLLGERFPDHEVVNAGVIGYLSGEELATMVYRFGPDEAVAYVVFDGWNELLDQLYYQRRLDYEFGFNNQFLILEGRLHKLYAEESGIEAEPPPPPPPEDDGYFDRLCTAYEENLARMHRVALGRGARLLAVLQPELGSKLVRTESEEAAFSESLRVYEGYESFPARYAAFRARVRGFCAKRGILVVDLAEEPAIRDEPAELFYDAVHLNVQGNRIVARIIGEELEKLLEI